MKKVLCLILALTFVLSTAGCGASKSTDSAGTSSSNPTAAQSAGISNSTQLGEVIELKLGTDCSNPSASTEYNGYGFCIQKFCDLVAEKTDGQVTVTPYYDSVLGKQSELFTQVRDSELDIFFGNALSTFDARFGFKGLPFLFKNLDQVHSLLASKDGQLYQLYADILGEYDIHLIAQGTGTLRGLANNKHPVASLEDMKDITLRIYEDQTVKAFFSPICNASVIAFNEAYTALQTKTCNAIELASSVIIQSKFYEVCNYYTDLDWQSMSQGFMMSDKAYSSLSDEQKKIVEDCAWEACEYEYGIQTADRQKGLDALRGLGVEVYELTDSERAAWQEYAQSLSDDYRSYIGAETYDKVIEIVNAANA
ncbi:MAG: TRAP transporter substrate-binding protein [Clostridia bacterium]|nr:TRAP transporter substrate-binding protein [Clostridia bacterium]